MPKATVREAVLLSLGLEPRPPVLTWTQYEAPRSYAEPGREFERRLMLAAAHVDASGPLRPLGSMPFLNGAENATVNLPEFGAWARGLGWELPKGFPRHQAQAQQAPVPTAPPVVAETASAGESQEQRQARRYRMCIDAGLTMPSDDYSHLPRGIGEVAKAEGITRQAFGEDVKAHIRRLNGR